jgi:hypothetical protein
MPAAWIGAGAAVVGAGSSLLGGSSSGGSNSNAVQAASPYQNYYGASASTLAGAAANNTYGAGVTGTNTIPGLDSFVNNQTLPLTGALNGTNYAQQINNLVANPSSIANTPQYQAAFGQGQSAVNSTLAAQGLNGSGNQLAALQNYGMSFEQNAYNTQLQQLSGLYGQSLGANQQAFNQTTGLNTQSYNQLAQLAGLQGNQALSAAGQLTAAGNQQTQAAVSNGISGLATAGQNLYNSGAFSSGTPSGTTTGTNQYGFSSGVSDPSYGVSYTGY